jgi:5-methylcytosine-specific restriction endonuclease McrA
MCQNMTPPRVTAATVVDHRVPHQGDQALFWDRSNWAALCQTHHNSTKQREEKQGQEIGCDSSGVPIDGKHHWNQ